MLRAAGLGITPLVRYLCEGLPQAQRVNPAADGNAAMWRAARQGRVQVVRYLCDLLLVRGVVDLAAGGSSARDGSWVGICRHRAVLR